MSDVGGWLVFEVGGGGELSVHKCIAGNGHVGDPSP